MYHVSAQGVDKRMINVHYYYLPHSTCLHQCCSHEASTFNILPHAWTESACALRRQFRQQKISANEIDVFFFFATHNEFQQLNTAAELNSVRKEKSRNYPVGKHIDFSANNKQATA